MTLLAFVPIVFAMATAGEVSALTFDEALALAAERAGSRGTASPVDIERFVTRSRLPAVRLEVTGNTSRSLEFFSEGPFEVRQASSVVAVEYPLWDGGEREARISGLRARLRRGQALGVDDWRFSQLLDAFGELYLVQAQQELLRPLNERSAQEVERSDLLLASGEITNLTAAERREIALGFASQLLELEARRIDAAARLRVLTGIESEPMVVIDVAQPAELTAGQEVRDDVVDAATIAVDETRARLREVEATAGFRAMLSGFAGYGVADSTFQSVSSYGGFGIYGLRINLSLPLLRGTGELAIAEARAELERSLLTRDAAVDAAKARASQYLLRGQNAAKRIELLRKSVEASREREESLARLISAGVRSESDLASAQADRTRREGELLAAEIERWKAGRLLARMTATGRE